MIIVFIPQLITLFSYRLIVIEEFDDTAVNIRFYIYNVIPYSMNETSVLLN